MIKVSKNFLVIGLGTLVVVGLIDWRFGVTPTAAAEIAELIRVDSSSVMKSAYPIKCGEYAELSGDPSILKDGPNYRLFCTGLDKTIMGGGIAEATSRDGNVWKTVATGTEDTGLGIVLQGKSDSWDFQLETAEVIKFRNKYWLFYSGYPEIGYPENPGQIGVAVSHDAKSFKRPVKHPILSPSADGYDTNGLYSPAVVIDPTNGMLNMIYAGHHYKNTSVPAGIYLLGATSPDGIKWTKYSRPVLGPSEKHDFMRYGVAEPALIYKDNYYYLFFTGGLGDDEQRVIAVARSKNVFGPYKVRRALLLTPTPGLFDHVGVLAPSVLIEKGKIRMWYLTSDGDKHMTGYAEMPWPLTGW